MRRVVTATAALFALIAGAAVLQLKLAVQDKAQHVEALAQKIHDDREAIRVLEAEWAYLTTPRALQNQSVRFLALMPPQASQIINSPDVIPYRPKGEDVSDDPGVLLPATSQKPTKDQRTRKKGESL